MSAAAKFECAPYKPFEPDYHPQRPIIVGEEGLESPETVTLKYEEAVARANGDLRGGSPQEGLLPMSQYGKPQPTPLMYQDGAYQAYGAPTYHGQHHDGSAQLSASQLNQGAFAANSAVGQYMSVGPTVVSCQPSTGMAGTKVMAKVSSQDDLLAMTSPMPYLYLAPDIMVTGCQGPNVPLTLLIEAANGEEVSRTAASTFAYHDASLAAPEVAQVSNNTAGLRFNYKCLQLRNCTSPAISVAVRTHIPPGQQHAQHISQRFLYGAALSSCRAAASAAAHGWLAADVWTDCGSPHDTHAYFASQSDTAADAHAYDTDTGFVRLRCRPLRAAARVRRTPTGDPAQLDPGRMSNRRRIVMFNKKQTGSTLTTTFRAVNVNERPPNSVCISCIWWAEKNECFVTSVDTIYLLEQLVVAPNRFSVEEKNRIRRNLEGFRPQTVSKAKSDSEEFFKIIMAFPNPKPRNIEKDVRCFPGRSWSRRSRRSSEIRTRRCRLRPRRRWPLMDVNVYGVQAHMHHHDTLTSPRSLSGSNHNWPTYTGAPTHSRALSPALTTGSPRQSSGRLSGPLPGVSAYESRPMAPHAYPGPSMHSSIVHQPTAPAAPGRWDPSAMPSMHPPATYAEQYQPISAHHGPSHPQVYSSNGYNDGAQRAYLSTHQDDGTTRSQE
ncbi:hypothetical protein EV126DRAFT_446916 [Verticillium dahliae]|nr:hypothetical protein EV126DRAFT_446916 [Verticillium dahliae]